MASLTYVLKIAAINTNSIQMLANLVTIIVPCRDVVKICYVWYKKRRKELEHWAQALDEREHQLNARENELDEREHQLDAREDELDEEKRVIKERKRELRDHSRK